MTLSIRLHSVMCLTESDEDSDSDEPYVLVTTVNLAAGGVLPDVRTNRGGPWEMDDGDVVEPASMLPIWDTNGRPADILDPNNVIIIVTVVEHDQGSPGGIRTLVQSTATATLAAAVGQPPNIRRQRLVADIGDAVGTADVGFTGEDHVGTKELRLTAADLAAPGTRYKELTFKTGDDGSYRLRFRLEELDRYEFGPNTHLAAVTRDPDRMELWTVDGTGTLIGNPFDQRWHGWYRLAGVAFPPAANLAAVTRQQDLMEVWAVGLDLSVHGVFFANGGWRDWYALAGVSFNPGAPLAAVSRHPNKLEVWCIDVDGRMWGIPFEGDHWEPWYPLDLPDDDRFIPGTPVTAISRGPDLMEVWAVDRHGTARGISYDGKGWGRWYALEGATFDTDTRLTVVSRHIDHMEILGIDAVGLPQGRRFDSGWAPEWYTIPGAGFTPGAPIAAVSRDPDLMEVWAIGTPDGLMRGNWYANGDWQAWYVIGDGPTIRQNTDMVGLSRSRGLTWLPPLLAVGPQFMELWTIGQDGVVTGVNFDGSDWRDWYVLEWSYSP